jgi:hypothetical protein
MLTSAQSSMRVIRDLAPLGINMHSAIAEWHSQSHGHERVPRFVVGTAIDVLLIGRIHWLAI